MGQRYFADLNVYKRIKRQLEIQSLPSEADTIRKVNYALVNGYVSPW